MPLSYRLQYLIWKLSLQDCSTYKSVDVVYFIDFEQIERKLKLQSDKKETHFQMLFCNAQLRMHTQQEIHSAVAHEVSVC